MYHATKFGIEGFCEALAQEVTQFHIGVIMVEPGDASKGLAPGDPARMAERIIESVGKEPAPLRMMFGSQALSATLARL